jgi:two-component system chemotaxis response regulator CheY
MDSRKLTPKVNTTLKDLLIVDDSIPVRKILMSALAHIDLPIGKILEAGDGTEALTFLDAYPVGLVLTDINMPNMNGIELLRAVRASPQWHNIPMVVITAEGAEASLQEAIESGANSFILKPFSIAALRQLVVFLPNRAVPARPINVV